MSVSASIPDTSLGLTSSEIQILRQQQQIALQGGHASNGVSRGRGIGRTSNSSSRAASAASSNNGRLLLDPMSLRALSTQLDSLQEQIRRRIEYVRVFLCQLVPLALTDRSWRIKCSSQSKTAAIVQETLSGMLMWRSLAHVKSLHLLTIWKMSWLRSAILERL